MKSLMTPRGFDMCSFERAGLGQIEIHHSQHIDVCHECLSDRDMQRAVHVLREGLTVRHGHDDAVGEAVCPIGIARSAFDLVHDGYEINQTPHSFQMHFYLL